MWQYCCSPENAPSLVASLGASVIGLFLLACAIDDWQVKRVREKEHYARDGFIDSESPADS
jgi:hypothetical protein